MKILFFVVGLIFSPISTAQMYQVDYHLGNVLVSENEDQIVLYTVPPLKIEILLGGPTWPQLSLDDTGRIYAGNIVIEPVTASIKSYPKATLVLSHDLEISSVRNGIKSLHAGKTCHFSGRQLGLNTSNNEIVSLKGFYIKFSRSADKLLALVRQFDQDYHTSNYFVEQIDLVHCKIGFRHNLGDPDYLVEINHSSKGGWWITGSIEQTLLQSNDGVHWRKATLPPDLGGLISAYVANLWEIWLAAYMLPIDDGAYDLVYSKDGGVTWSKVFANDPVLERMPVGWLEGQKRRVLH